MKLDLISVDGIAFVLALLSIGYAVGWSVRDVQARVDEELRPFRRRLERIRRLAARRRQEAGDAAPLTSPAHR